MQNIKYVFLGNSQTVKEIGEYPSKVQDTWITDTRSIFEKYCKNSQGKYEVRNRVVGKNGNYYFTITPTNIFYLVVAEDEYPEKLVFDFIDEAQKDNIFLLVNEKGELNKIGKQQLKNLIESYQDPSSKNKIKSVTNDIQDIKIEMTKDIRKLGNNIEDAEKLEDRSKKVADGAKLFNQGATDLKRKTCLQNYKWGFILGLLIVAILLVIIIPLAVSGGGDGKSEKDSNNTSKQGNLV